MTTPTQDVCLPKTLRVETGCIHIEARLDHLFHSLDSLERYCSEVKQLLALIPTQHKAAAQCLDSYGWLIETDSLPALKYANELYMLDEYNTALTSAADYLRMKYKLDLTTKQFADCLETIEHKSIEILTFSDGKLYLHLEEDTDDSTL